MKNARAAVRRIYTRRWLCLLPPALNSRQPINRRQEIAPSYLFRILSSILTTSLLRTAKTGHALATPRVINAKSRRRQTFGHKPQRERVKWKPLSLEPNWLATAKTFFEKGGRGKRGRTRARALRERPRYVEPCLKAAIRRARVRQEETPARAPFGDAIPRFVSICG